MPIAVLMTTYKWLKFATAKGDSFSAKKTTVLVSFEENGEDRIAYIPLLTVSSIEADPGVSSPA